MKARFEDVIARVTGNVDRYKTDLEFYVGGDQYDSSALTIERRGDLKKDVDILGFKFHFPFKSGDVLLMARNPHLRKAGQVFFDGLCSDASYILRTKDESRLRQNYIPIILQSNHFWDWFESHKTGGITFLMNWGMLKTYEFELPDIKEQDIIMTKVWAAYKLKKTYQSLISATDEMVKSRFIEMFGQVSDTAPRHDVKKLSDCCSYISDGSHFSPAEDSAGTYPMLSVKDMTENGFVYSDCKYISKKDFDVLVSNGCQPHLNDVLVAKDGSYFKYSFVVTDNKEQAILSSIAILRPQTDIIDPKYLSYYMLTDAVIQLVEKNYLTGTAIRRVILKGFKEIPTIVPPMELQKSFVAVLDQADKSKFELRQAIEKIDKVMRALIG